MEGGGTPKLDQKSLLKAKIRIMGLFEAHLWL